VSNAIEQHNWQEAAEQIDVTAKVIESYAQQVDRAGAVLGSPLPRP
jgi:hypothetical protein